MKTSQRTSSALRLVEEPVDDAQHARLGVERHELVDERHEHGRAVRRPHLEHFVGGRLEHVRDLTERPAGDGLHRQAQEVADPVVRLGVELAAGGEQLAALEGDGRLAGGGEIEKHERALIGPPLARDRARDDPFSALRRMRIPVAQVELGAPAQPVKTAGCQVEIELTAQPVDLAEDAASPQGRCAGVRCYFVAPHVFTGVSPDAVIAQEEIFGPVVAVIKVADLDEALAVANGVKYALTGGLISRSPAAIERCRQEFRVGNLYINRGITGALVERQPFGGFKMSGVGSKAGGPDYLLQFLEPRVTTENTMRRGFAPPDELLED